MTTTSSTVSMLAGCWTTSGQESGSAAVDPALRPQGDEAATLAVASALEIFAVTGAPRVDAAEHDTHDTAPWSDESLRWIVEHAIDAGRPGREPEGAASTLWVRWGVGSGVVEVGGTWGDFTLDHSIAASMAREVAAALARTLGTGRDHLDADTNGGSERTAEPGATAYAGADAVPDLVELIVRTAEQFPDRQAVRVGIRGPGADVLTYRQLIDQARGTAGAIEAMGAGGVVAVPFRRESAMVSELLGVLLGGRAYVLLSPGDSDRYTGTVMERTGATLVPGHHPDQAPTPSMKRGSELRADAPAYLSFTSGTTGMPKGVAIGRGALSNYCAFLAEAGICGPEVLLPLLSAPGFDAIVKQTWGQLAAGGAVVIPEGDDLLRSIDLALGIPGAVVNTVPAVWREVLDHSEATDPTGRVLLGGEELTPELARLTGERFPGLRVTNLYGPTECTSNALWADVATADRDLVTIGFPVRGTAAAVVGPAGAPVPFGAPGELVLSGAGLALGYVGNGRATASSFGPADRGGRTYATGDRVRETPDGLMFLGRYDSESKVNGVRVDTVALAASLVGHEGVTGAVVTAVDGALRVYFRGPQPDALPRLKSRIKGTWRRETWPTELVLVEELPTEGETGGDPVARLSGAGPDAGPAGAAETVAAPAAEAAVETPVDGTALQVVETLWATVLGRTDGVPRDASFTALGGTSMKSLKLVAMYRRLFGVQVGLDEFRDRQTLDEHVELLSGRVTEADFDRLVTSLEGAR